MKRKLLNRLLCTALVCLIMSTVVMADGFTAVENEYLETVEEQGSDLSAITDPAFYTFLLTNGWYVTETIRSLQSLYIVGRGIQDLAGIELFINLTILNCSDNQLTNLDVSGCTKLEGLNCQFNRLTSLDVSGCTKLKQLFCSDNQLTSLDITSCPYLTELYENTKPVEENGSLVYQSSDGSRQLIVDPGVRIITVHTHKWDSGKVTKAATTTSTGIRTYTCTVCGETRTETIARIKTTPVKKITISRKPAIQKPTATKRKITVRWKHFKHTSKKARKIWKKVKKVQVQCALDRKFTNIVKDAKVRRIKTKYTINGLKKKTKYYVRVRYFDGTGYSAWSKVRKIKTK